MRNHQKGTPARALRRTQQAHACLPWGPVAFACVTLDARADNIFPGGGALTVTWDDVVQIQFLAVQDPPAILALVLVAFEDVVAGEFDLLAGKPVEEGEKDDLGDSDLEGNRVDRIRVPGVLCREMAPSLEIQGGEFIAAVVHHMGLTLKEQTESPPGRADIDRLPEPVQNQHICVKC